MKQENQAHQLHKYNTIKKVILFCMILVPLIPFILSIGIGYYYFSTSIEDSVILNMKRIVQDHRRMIDSFFMERESDLEFVVNSYSLKELSQPEKLDQVFYHLKKSSSAFADLGVFNQDGIHVAYRGPHKLIGKVYKRAEWFKMVMQKRSYISDIFLGYRQTPHFVIAVASNHKTPTWVIRASIDTQTFDALVEGIRIGKTGEAFIANSDGILQTNCRSGGNLMDPYRDYLNFPYHQDEIMTFTIDDHTGKSFIYATTWLAQKKWLLVVRQSKSEAFQMLRNATMLIFVVSILGGVVIVGVAFYATNKIVGRMRRMDVEKEQLGKQLIHASRLAELGEMAAGFAHEINNPLQIIKNEQSLIDISVSELKDMGILQPSSQLGDIEESIEQIQLQISRCSQITQSILKFSRQTEPVFSTIYIPKIVSEVSAIVGKKADINGINVQYNISPETPPVLGDSTQLQQVLLNLYNNSIDAIIEKNGSTGGRITVKAEPINNNWVEVSVSDNGSGIKKENLDKIFTPFFTTKTVGKGTGLGLAVCYGIIKSMGGNLEVKSEEGNGTTIIARLPST